MLENNSGTAGYMQIFTVLTVMLVLGAITVLIWKAYLKKQENK